MEVDVDDEDDDREARDREEVEVVADGAKLEVKGKVVLAAGGGVLGG